MVAAPGGLGHKKNSSFQFMASKGAETNSISQQQHHCKNASTMLVMPADSAAPNSKSQLEIPEQ